MDEAAALQTLEADLGRIKTRARARVAAVRGKGRAAPATPELAARAAHPPLAALAARYGLSRLEGEVLLAVLAPHLDPEVLPLYRELRGAGFWDGVELRLLLQLFADSLADQVAVRRALSAQAPLVRRGLVVVAPGRNSPSLLHWTVDVAPRLVHFAAGEALLGEPPARACERLEAGPPLGAVQAPVGAVASALAVLGGDPEGRERAPAVVVQGVAGTGKTTLARALAAAVGRPLLRVRDEVWAMPLTELPGALRAVQLEVELEGAALLVDSAEAVLALPAPSRRPLLELLGRVDAPVLLEVRDPEAVDAQVHQRVDLVVELPLPAAAARECIWRQGLEAAAASGVEVAADACPMRLASSYHFTGAEIATAVRAASHLARQRAREDDEPPRLDAAVLGRAAELQLRASLHRYSLTLPGFRTRADIVLQPDTAAQVDELLDACRHRHVVMDGWGFRARLSTGHGIVSLFDGPPGTGKTFCAEILGAELAMPVARINIPSIVSKWVGETEQHIADIFRRGRSARAILLFDEADSLFGSRVAETKSATDRYANMSVNLLLQEIERYDGIVILTTNLVSALDSALLRRVQFRVSFPELDGEHRARIYRSLVERAGLAEGALDYEWLAESFALSGGRIQNAVLRAAYRAASEGATRLSMRHLTRAAVEEARAAGVLVREAEPW